MLGRSERKSLNTQVSLILTEAIKNNLETHSLFLEQLREDNMTMVPDPFCVTPLQVILQGKFVEVMRPELVSELTTTYRYCLMMNSHQARFTELVIGPASSLTHSMPARQELIRECLRQMPGLKASLIKAQGLLQSVYR